jgi:hypothetical protein
MPAPLPSPPQNTLDSSSMSQLPSLPYPPAPRLNPRGCCGCVGANLVCLALSLLLTPFPLLLQATVPVVFSGIFGHFWSANKFEHTRLRYVLRLTYCFPLSTWKRGYSVKWVYGGSTPIILSNVPVIFQMVSSSEYSRVQATGSLTGKSLP